MGGQQIGYNNNRGGDESGNAGRNSGGRKFKRRNSEVDYPNGGGNTPTRPGWYLREGPHKCNNCRTVWTPRPRRPPRVPCPAGISTLDTAISKQDYSRGTSSTLTAHAIT